MAHHCVSLRVLALALLATPLLLTCSEQQRGVSQSELLRRLASAQPPFVLDVRTPEEFAQGHVPRAVNIAHSELSQRIGELAPYRDGDVVLYCERGARAADAGETLRAAGFDSVLHLDGDMSSWRSSGLPIERPE
jgi:rhodanese-related sulfurtransferase